LVKCCAALVVGLGLVLTGCVSTRSKCPIETLLVDQQLFPDGTHAEPLESPLPEYPAESAARTFYYAPDSVFQEVVNWRSGTYARREFDLNLRSAFDVDKYRGPWSTPNDLYVSSVAQDYHAACGVAGQVFQCRMVATYDGYSVLFRAEVSEQGITMSKVDELLHAIDRRMADCTNHAHP